MAMGRLNPKLLTNQTQEGELFRSQLRNRTNVQGCVFKDIKKYDIPGHEAPESVRGKSVGTIFQEGAFDPNCDDEPFGSS